MQSFFFLLCALLFSLGDYLCSLELDRVSRYWTTALGALVGALGYLVFSHLSRTTPLSALGGYINGAVVLITCVGFGYLLQGNKLSAAEWCWIAVIFIGLCGLAYSRSSAA